MSAEFIELWWDGDPDFFMVRGHVEKEAALEAVANYEGRRCIEALTCTHGYAMNQQTHYARQMGLNFTIGLYETPGRGRYKVTILHLPAYKPFPSEGT